VMFCLRGGSAVRISGWWIPSTLSKLAICPPFAWKPFLSLIYPSEHERVIINSKTVKLDCPFYTPQTLLINHRNGIGLEFVSPF